MRTTRLLPCALALCVASAAAAQTIRTDYDKNADFTKFKTFAFREGTPAPTPFVQQRIEAAIASELEARGMTRASGDPDLLVFTHTQVSTEKVVDVDHFGYRGYYGWRGASGSTSVNVREIPVGTVMVDLVNAKPNEIAWRGIAQDTLSTNPTPEKSEKRIQKAMAKLFKKYPVPKPEK